MTLVSSGKHGYVPGTVLQQVQWCKKVVCQTYVEPNLLDTGDDVNINMKAGIKLKSVGKLFVVPVNLYCLKPRSMHRLRLSYSMLIYVGSLITLCRHWRGCVQVIKHMNYVSSPFSDCDAQI